MDNQGFINIIPTINYKIYLRKIYFCKLAIILLCCKNFNHTEIKCNYSVKISNSLTFPVINVVNICLNSNSLAISSPIPNLNFLMLTFAFVNVNETSSDVNLLTVDETCSDVDLTNVDKICFDINLSSVDESCSDEEATNVD